MSFFNKEVIVACVVCGGSPLVKSHIIPKAMYAFGEPKANRFEVRAMSLDATKRAKRVPSGVYCEFLCRAHEDVFQDVDDYAAKFLQAEATMPPRGVPHVTLPNFNGKMIALFFMSVLWRAHHANHEFFRNINLGQAHEKGLWDVILGGDANADSRYSVILQRLDTQEPFTGFLTPYFSKNLSNRPVNHYVVCIPWFRAFIKVDQRPWSESLDNVVLRDDAQIGFFLQDKQDSKELKLMVDMAKKNPNLF